MTLPRRDCPAPEFVRRDGGIARLARGRVAGRLAVVSAVMMGAVPLVRAGAADPRKDPPKKEPVAAETAAPVNDGFPLPAGAIHRFGNRQLRHLTGITVAAVSPDGKFLATGSFGGVVVWDLKTLAAKRSFPRLPLSYSAYLGRGVGLAFLPDSKSLLVSVRPATDGPVRVDQPMELAQVWDVETGKKKFGLPGDYDVY
ncbi:MAG: hypothetical protein J2P46_20585, partial [Zavarzinella sp.]|nr:hypothetical protein [Zavarzinella sp.]